MTSDVSRIHAERRAFDPDPFVERMPAFGFPWDVREMAPKT